MASQLRRDNISIHFFMNLRLGNVPVEELCNGLPDHGKQSMLLHESAAQDDALW